MKILQLSTKVPYPPKDGGAAGVYVFSTVFSKLGHDVTILAVNPLKHFISRSVLSEIQLPLQIHTVEINTNPIWHKALFNLAFQTLPYQVERFIDKTYENNLIDLLRTISPEIVQIEGVYLCPYIPIIRKHSNAKIVLRSHNIEHIIWQDIITGERNFLKKRYLKIQTKRLKQYEVEQFAKVDGVTTVTENDMAVIESFHSGLKIKTIPFGLLSQEKVIEKSPSNTAIAFIGALDWLPNQEALHWFISSVWPKINAEFPQLQFHIAGRNASSPLTSLIRQQKSIVFHGEIPDSKEFLSQFNILIVPLFSGSGIRVKIIEAMQQGLVVIASTKAADGIPAISGKHLLLADTPEEFLAKLTLVIEDPNMIEELSMNAMCFIREKFDILAIASELIDFYKDISNG